MLILPREFPELKALIQRISGGESIPPSPDPAPLPGRIWERTVHPNSFDVVDGILIYNTENRNPQRLDRAVLYQPWVDRFRRRYNGRDPRYHILHCSTIQEVQYARYVPTSRADGKFLVILNGREDEIELQVCQNCLNLLIERYGAGVFPQNPAEFPLADWLETFEFDYSSDVWEERSRACRENANWRCEQCGIDLEFHRYLLHAHHKWGTRYNEPEDLMALCIGCHARQNGGGHQTLRYHPAHQQFMQVYGAQWRTRRQAIQNQTSTEDSLDDIP